MSHSSLIKALFVLMRFENKKMALWDKAEPISLEELKAKFAALALARNDVAFKAEQSSLEPDDALTLEELWRIFESLEELEDRPLIS